MTTVAIQVIIKILKQLFWCNSLENKNLIHKTPVDELQIYLCGGQTIDIRMQYSVYPNELYQGDKPFFKYIATELIHNTEVRRVIALPSINSSLADKLSLISNDIKSNPEILINMFGII